MFMFVLFWVGPFFCVNNFHGLQVADLFWTGVADLYHGCKAADASERGTAKCPRWVYPLVL